MKQVIIKKADEILLPVAGLADSFFLRFRGLMFRKSMPENYGLLIVPCNQIHTFNMKFPIDVVYLSKENKVVKVDAAVKPWKSCKIVKGGHSVLELCPGVAAALSINEGDHLTILPQ